jgi:hypothetical protein
MKRNVLTSFVLLALSVAAPESAPAQAGGSAGGYTMALAGDAIITRSLSMCHEPQFLRLVELIRNADVAFVNLEVLLHDYEPFPMHQSSGTWLRADPAMARRRVSSIP